MSKPASPSSVPPFGLYVGIDISAKTAFAAFYQPEIEEKPTRTLNFKQLAEGFASLQTALSEFTVPPTQVLIVMEATSNYHLELATLLDGLGYHVAVLNPAAAANWVKSKLIRTKTDKQDALNLARLAAEVRPPKWNPAPALYEELKQRLSQRAQLVELRTATRNQLHALKANPKALAHLLTQREELIVFVSKQIEQLETELKTLSQQTDEWATSISLLQTIPGIGLLTACLLVALYRNFSNCSSPAAATQYAGLAPNERSSGTSVRGYQAIGQGGQAQLRQFLYMAALAATRKGAVLHLYYTRMVEIEKKPAKVALIAVARKLLHLAYTIVKKQEAFDRATYESNWAARQAPKAKAENSKLVELGA